MRGPLSFEVRSQFISAGQSNYRAAWSDRLARSEQSVCSALTLFRLTMLQRTHSIQETSLCLTLTSWKRNREHILLNVFTCRVAELWAELLVFLWNSPFVETKVAELAVDLAPLAATLLQKTLKFWKEKRPTSALIYAAVSFSWVCVVAFHYFLLLNDRNLQLMSSSCFWSLVSGPSCCPAVRWSCCTHSCLPAPRLTVIKRWRKRANCECVGKHFSLTLNVCLRSKSRRPRIPRIAKQHLAKFWNH